MEIVEIVIFYYIVAWLVVLSVTKNGKPKKRSRKRKFRNIDDYVNEFGEGIIEYKEK